MTPKAKYYETLANTMIKNFEKEEWKHTTTRPQKKP